MWSFRRKWIRAKSSWNSGFDPGFGISSATGVSPWVSTREVTCAAKIIDDPLRAAKDIDEIVRSVWLHQQPGYIEIHRDMVEKEISVPSEIVAWDGELPYPHSDRHKLKEAVRETAERFNRAENPIVLVGIEAYRFKSARDIVKLVEKMGVPCCTSVLAKGAFPMNHPLYMGVYAGGVSPAGIRARVERADLIISLGMFLTDIEMGGSQPPEALRNRSIWSVENRVNISFHTYTDITLRDFVHELLRAALKRHREKVTYCDNLPAPKKNADKRIRVADVLHEINSFLAHRKGFMVVAESGDSLFGGIDIKVGNDGLYLAQGFYASMGFAVPGALGAQIGTRLRPLILTGDGGFQMTGSEIAHALRYRLNPMVILLNNGDGEFFDRSPSAMICWHCPRGVMPNWRDCGAGKATKSILPPNCGMRWNRLLGAKNLPSSRYR